MRYSFISLFCCCCCCYSRHKHIVLRDFEKSARRMKRHKCLHSLIIYFSFCSFVDICYLFYTNNFHFKIYLEIKILNMQYCFLWKSSISMCCLIGFRMNCSQNIRSANFFFFLNFFFLIIFFCFLFFCLLRKYLPKYCCCFIFN